VCKKLYLDMAISLPFYGFTFFSVKVFILPPPPYLPFCQPQLLTFDVSSFLPARSCNRPPLSLSLSLSSVPLTHRSLASTCRQS
jgi:hypothetical protein